MEGFGEAIYANSIYPFPKKPPFIDHKYNPVGSYRTSFTVPKDWNGRKTIITFDGVDSAFYLWVNGKKIGYNQGSRTPSSFDITEVLKDGNNLLAVEVYRWCDGSYLEDQDFWRLSGIFRDVYLKSRPEVGIRDFRVKTNLDKNYKNAELELSVEVKNSGNKEAAKKVSAVLLDANDKVVAELSEQTVKVAANTNQSITLKKMVTNPAKWTAETPNLYQLLIKITEPNGKVIEVIPQRVGFRAVEMIDGILKVNGKRIVIKGANRHEHHPTLGHVVTEESMLRDIKLLKEGNFNAVRTCHYPNVSRWYELCDEYGLYVADEANVETHGMGWGRPHKLAKSPEWKESHISRVRNMFERDKNYPSIIAWSIGNESGKGANLQASYKWLKDHDKTRSVGYEQIGKGGYTDYWTPMYANPNKIVSYAKNNPKRPVILCEYTHAMGNSNGNLKEYWDATDKYPKAQGGFVWDWMDQGLELKTKSGKTYYGYGGDLERKGTRHDNNFCMNGVLAADWTPHPGYYTLKKCQEGVRTEAVDAKNGKIKITNKYSFINLSDLLVCNWTLTSKGQVIAEGSNTDLNIAPDQSKVINLNLPKKTSDSEIWLNVSYVLKENTPYAEKGFQLAWEQLKYADAPKAQTKGISVPIKSCKESSTKVTIEGQKFSVVISKETGQISSYVINGKSMFKQGPKADFWRALTDNDRGYRAYDVMKKWEKAPESLKIDSVDVKKSTNSATITVAGKFTSINNSEWNVTYLVKGDGSVKVTNSFTPKGKLSKILRVGTQLIENKGFDQFSWYGRGPNPTYSDRKLEPIGVFAGTVDEQWVDYSRPQENGNKVDVRWSALRDDKGYGILAVSEKPLSVAVRHYSHNDMKGDPKTTKYYKPRAASSTGSSEGAVKDMVKGGVRHTHEMKKRDEIYWSLDAVQQGVGGNNSWGQWPMSAYLISPDKNYTWTYTFKPLTPTDNIWEKAK